MEFTNPQEGLERFQHRLTIAGGFVLLCFLLLFVRFFWLQVIQNSYFDTRAEENRISLVPIVPNRGLILDRNGLILARNYSAYTLEITPDKIQGDVDTAIDELTTVIDVQPKDRKRFRKLLEESKNFESLPIRTRLSDEEVARFVAYRYRFPGIDVKARLFRHYPFGAFASHLLGHIGRVNDKDLERIAANDQEANYRGTDHFGKTGLEQRYEMELHGTTGFEKIEVDAGGHAVRTMERTPPVAGNNLVLTIDAKLQEIAEKAFGKRRGALVAIEPSTGGVLALVSMPNYDPNLFVDGIATPDWDALNTSSDKPMVNRALYGTYPPGSTFKPFMALAALATGKRRPEQTIFDPGYFAFGNYTFRDSKPSGHGVVNMHASIVHSCDTYYYMLANDLGIDNIATFMYQFGFGQRTGIDIGVEGSAEAEGVLPSQEWKRRRFKKPEQQKWYAGETISIGIGQGYNSYTPIQLAQATAGLANDGVMYRPHLVQSVIDARTGTRSVPTPTPPRTIRLKQEHIDIVKHAMAGVNKEGTGARAFAGAGYESAGKTGTAQVYSLKGADYKEHLVKEELRDHALYIAFAPKQEPRIALAVLVENGGFGAQTAAPIARQVLDYYLLGKVPDTPAPTDADAIEEER